MGRHRTQRGRQFAAARARPLDRVWASLVGQAPPPDGLELTPPPEGGEDYGTPERSAWIDIDWREHLRSERVHGVRVNYIELGSGSPVVFIHGLSGCWQNWLENIPHFARRHRVIAVDLPGFGDSELPQEEISLPGYGRFVDAFLGQVGVERAAVVGNSMGGFIAAEVAINHPSRVEKLVLVSAAGGPTLRERNSVHGSRIARAARLIGPLIAAGAARRERLVRRPKLRAAMLWKIATHPERLSAEICYEVASGAGKPGFIDALNAIFDYDFTNRIPDITCPTLIVWGEKDEIVPVGDALEYERLIPGARKVIFEDTGHVPMVERPARFNRIVEEFLAAPTATPSEAPATVADDGAAAWDARADGKAAGKPAISR